MSQLEQKRLGEDASQLETSLSQSHDGTYLRQEAGMKRTCCVVLANHLLLHYREL